MADLKVFQCIHCDFGSGQRGVDRCGKCNGTGSGFYVKNQFYPNTKNGYEKACAAYEKACAGELPLR